jgi:hypothetical protein
MSTAAIRPVAAQLVSAGLAEREYRRLLQWPRGRDLPEELRARAQAARDWYARHGRTFVAARRLAVRAIGAETVELESGPALQGRTLAAGLHGADAHAVAIVVASAGHEVAAESARRWEAGFPDEAFFLDRLAAGLAEALLARAASDLCRGLAPQGEHLLPHQSPGCGDWDLAEQHRLMEILRDASGPVTLLESGALRPQHSLLALFGITRRAAATANPVSACRRCDLAPCAYRRMPFQCDTSRP